MKTIKEFILLENENILAQIEGDAFNTSPNPIAKCFGAAARFISSIFGMKLRTYIIATNQRIVKIEKTTLFWGLLKSDISVHTLNKRNIQSVGYMTSFSWFVFKTHYFVISNMGSSVMVAYNGSGAELAQHCTVFDEIICNK